jgi:hypothetical protein
VEGGECDSASFGLSWKEGSAIVRVLAIVEGGECDVRIVTRRGRRGVRRGLDLCDFVYAIVTSLLSHVVGC